MGNTMKLVAKSTLAFVVALALVVPVCITGASTKAFADSASSSVGVSGVDCMQTESTELEILKTENLGEKSIFIDLAVTDGSGNTTQLLKLHEYNQKDAPEGTDFELAQIVTLSLNGKKISDVFGSFGSDPRYTVSVYENFYGGEPIYEGEIYPIYAELKSDMATQYKLVGIRTANADELAATRNVGVGDAYYVVSTEDGKDEDAANQNGDAGTHSSKLDTYTLKRAASNCDVEFRANSFVATYVKDADASSSDSVTGSIRYVDTDGNLIKTTAVPGIGEQGKEIYIEPQFNNDGKFYRALSNLAGTTRVIMPEYPTITVRVVEVLGMSESAYSVTIYYVDDNNDYLWEDTIDVKGYGYQYTLPEAFSMSAADGVEYYRFESVSANIIPNGKNGVKPTDPPALTNPIVFDRSMDADSNFAMVDGKRTVTAKFVSKDIEKALTVIEVDGSTNETLETVTQDITREKGAVYNPEERATALAQAHGDDYVSWSGNEAIECTWDDLESGVDIDLLQYAYYVPEGYTPTEDYDVSVQYVNVADSSVVKSESVKIAADQSGYVNINGPERFEGDDGNTYVRLAGQDRGFNHSYYTNARTYTIYYRDVNDVLNANTVINRVQIIESTLPGTTTTIAATATPVPVATPEGDAAIETGITPGDGTAVITDDATPLANLAGEDTVTERTIADNENPLASAPRSDAADGLPLPAILGISAGVLGLIAALAIFLMYQNKRKRENASVAGAGRR